MTHPEMRKKVAEHCTGYQAVIDQDRILVDYAKAGEWLLWRPDFHLVQKDQLTRKIAELIEALPSEEIYEWPYQLDCRARLSEALSTGSTNDLEALLAELLEAGNG